MDTVMMLLERAWQAGLRACAEGDKLVVRGPKHAAELAEQLLEHKTEVLALLQQPPVCRQCGRPQHEADVICPDRRQSTSTTRSRLGTSAQSQPSGTLRWPMPGYRSRSSGYPGGTTIWRLIARSMARTGTRPKR